MIISDSLRQGDYHGSVLSFRSAHPQIRQAVAQESANAVDGDGVGPGEHQRRNAAQSRVLVRVLRGRYGSGVGASEEGRSVDGDRYPSGKPMGRTRSAHVRWE